MPNNYILHTYILSKNITLLGRSRKKDFSDENRKKELLKRINPRR